MPEITLIENDVKSFQNPMEAEMNTVVKHFEAELLKIRTGRAHTSLVEDVMVIGYTGQPTPLKHMAVLNAPEPRLITIQPWDESTITAIEKAISTSELGLTPLNDGKIIRLQLPEMSTSRREELIKILNKKTNEHIDRVRKVRQEFNNLLRDSKKNKKISENFASRLEDVLEKVTQKFTESIKQHEQKKEKDIRAV